MARNNYCKGYYLPMILSSSMTEFSQIFRDERPFMRLLYVMIQLV